VRECKGKRVEGESGEYCTLEAEKKEEGGRGVGTEMEISPGIP